LTSAFALAMPSDASLIPARANQHHVQRRHAHKAGKHHRSKRPHHNKV
jgi:hypothetical protein